MQKKLVHFVDFHALNSNGTFSSPKQRSNNSSCLPDIQISEQTLDHI